jgi:protein-disulfide isomerase
MKITKISLVVVFLVSVCTPAAFSQSVSAEDIKGLHRDLDAVRDSLKVIQNQIDTLTKLVQQPQAAAPQPQAFRETTIDIGGAPVLGDKNAKVTLVEFSDYQCPFCGRNFQQTFPQILSNYIKTGKVKYVFRDFPLETIHPFAFKASEAARCAGEQGKYWEMHDRLFANQAALAANDLIAHGKAVGVDEGKFKTCMDSGRQATKIRDEQAQVRKLGITGTPGFFMGLTQPNESTIQAVRFINGAQPFDNFKIGLDELLAPPK